MTNKKVDVKKLDVKKAECQHLVLTKRREYKLLLKKKNKLTSEDQTPLNQIPEEASVCISQNKYKLKTIGKT